MTALLPSLFDSRDEFRHLSFTLAQVSPVQDRYFQPEEGRCMAETEEAGVMSLTVTLLSAYFANNTVPSSELPALVEGTRRALLGGAPVAASAPEVKTEEDGVEVPAPASDFRPAVTVEESLLSDGRAGLFRGAARSRDAAWIGWKAQGRVAASSARTRSRAGKCRRSGSVGLDGSQRHRDVPG
ncbi:hypothetical protein [Sphingobium sp. MK2]|uniref:hypothetical protein n=1 Tax=Sphingobium sp. MK2 TaxID=3116540 RepID=UPI0032E35F0E